MVKVELEGGRRDDGPMWGDREDFNPSDCNLGLVLVLWVCAGKGQASMLKKEWERKGEYAGVLDFSDVFAAGYGAGRNVGLGSTERDRGRREE